MRMFSQIFKPLVYPHCIYFITTHSKHPPSRLDHNWSLESLLTSNCPEQLSSNRNSLFSGLDPGSSVAVKVGTRLHFPEIFFSFFCCEPSAAAKLLQSFQTLCDPIDSSPPDSPVPGILQARTLEWVAIAFSIWYL